ncbi:DHA1 family tetracycline resistance protein-like MFS transporter [Devosia sp. UYZn731]|uniref:Tet(A)/Tet(B)/Tet(C) family tetracycline efflux MFS transporter n=1 Tax=Devosia sp. UYZn731 TaxID=3156345 RepID=UPI003396A58F
MNRSIVTIILIVVLDAIGIGLIFPILPSLLEELTGSGQVSLTYGIILAAYAAMQFVFSPILGMLSDRYGRRPVMIVSLAGAAIDYLIMAFAPHLWVLLLGRIIAGITSANMSVAGAYIADITDEKDRAQRFSWMSAAFGVGFIIGPVMGGLLSVYFLRAPFLAAAVLNALNLILVLTVVKESRVPSREPLQFKALNPLGPLKWAFSFPALAPLIAMFLIFAINGVIPGTISVLYGRAQFHFDGVTIGLWMAAFGICHTVAQALITGPLSKRFGDRGTLVIGVVVDTLAFLGFAFATQGWMAFALSPLSAIGGVGLPALQSLMSAQVSEDRQGELQGVLASAQSMTSIIGPLIGTSIFAMTSPAYPGAVWLVAAALYLLSIPVLAWVFRTGTPQPA